MSISSSATGLRPGVCTSTTRPTSPYTGMTIYETDTGYLRVWDGSAWDYLSQKQDNTVGLGPVGGLVYITEANFYGVASYDFTSVFSSNFDAYRFVATDAYTSTSSIHVQFQMLSGTTPATTNYHTQRLYAQGATVGGSGTGSGTAGQGSLCYLDNISEGGYYFDIFNPYLALKTNVISQAVYQYAGIEYHNSKHAVSTSYDGIRIKTGSGLMYANIRVYGYRKAL